MRLSALLALAATLAPSLAQSNFSETYVIDQSANFNLVVQSSNETFNGKTLGACHNGAAHEALCLYDGDYNNTDNFASFQFNTTRYICTETNSTGTFTVPCSDEPVDPTLETGIVTWWLQFSGEDGLDEASQAFILEYMPWTMWPRLRLRSHRIAVREPRWHLMLIV